MARDLPTRLVLTYCAVSLAALLMLGSVFTALLATSADSVHAADLRNETSSVARQLEHAFARGISPGGVQGLIRRDSELLGKRIVLVNVRGQVRYDSARWTAFSRGAWRLVDLGALRAGTWARLRGRGQVGLQSPLMLDGRTVGAVTLFVSAADVGIPWAAILPGLLRVLLALLAVWVAAALVLTRWLSGPLRSIAAGLSRVKEGKLDETIPEHGWSEARILARRYNEMVAEVARSRQAQRDFVANAAHELKTPVSLVAGFARSLADGAADRAGMTEEAVGYIRQESENLARIVEQLFALAGIDADADTQAFGPCRPEAILRDTVNRFSWRASAVRTVIDVASETNLPECLWDGELISSALANLIDNALEHAPDSTRITAHVFLQNERVAFEIADEGDGIGADDLPHIFDRFYRGEKRGRGHAGLGLALVHEVARRHGGTITASNRAEGAVFTLSLPPNPPGVSVAGRALRLPEISA